MASTYVTATIDPIAWQIAETIMSQLPVEIHARIIPRVMRKTLKPFVEKAKEILHADHDSDLTGTGAKQSAAVRASRAGNAHLWTTVKQRVRTYDNWTTVGLAGPDFTAGAGNLINFWSHEKQHYLWGPTYYGILPMFDSLTQAAQQTEAEQSAIFIAELIREVAADPLIVAGMATGNASFGTGAP